jgi:uncharacterized protein (TIGR02996 family)
MTPDNPFLQALLAQPDDDTLRLAMADWLDEQDQPARAEFVRVQVELARGVADRARQRALELRQSQLLFAHDAEWVEPLAKVLGLRKGEWGGWVFRRGFVEYFRLPALTLVARGAGLAKLTPVRELNLDGSHDAELLQLLRQPWLRSVTHLYGVELTREVAVAMLESPFLMAVRFLDAPWSHLSWAIRRRLVKQFGHALPKE